MTDALPYLFGALALIHALPAFALIAPGKLSALYGFAPGDQTLTTLLQHRALMFGVLAAALLYAALIPATRWPVLIGAVASMGGFIAIAAARRELSGALRSIVLADIIGLLIAALAAFTLLRG
jgi:hypothetical protein